MKARGRPRCALKRRVVERWGYVRACLDSRPVVLLVLPDLILDPEIVLMVLFSIIVWIQIAIVLLIK